MKLETVVLNRTSRILSGHLWVFSNELSVSPKKFSYGSLVELRDRKNAFLGVGYINANSLIAVRILTRDNEEINEGFFKRRILNALEYRKRFIGASTAFRAVYSEGDLLPGLIVDKYADVVSVQFLTLGMEKLSDSVLNAVDEVFSSPSAIILRNDSSIRSLEGLPLEKRVVKGSLDTLPVVEIGASRFEVDPMSGQKTGYFLDQAENRRAFSRLITGGDKGLDLFCYTGAWSVEMAKKGISVVGVDSSEGAVVQAGRNARMNDVEDRCSFVKADVFEFVKKELAGKRRYGAVVLDPPAFVKSRAKINEGARAYRELNAQAMRLLDDGGLLATSSCSFHISREVFLDILRASAKDAGRSFRAVEIRGQAKDHPVSLGVPETEYLKCVILQMI